MRSSQPSPFLRLLPALASALLLAACGGGGGDDGGGGSDGGGGGSTGTSQQPSNNVTISGTITYDFVPAQAGLNFALTEARPARLVTVQYVAGSSVLASDQTDANGNYSLVVPADRSGFVRARAESVRSGAVNWNFRVLDNVNGNILYTLDGAPLSSGADNSVRDLHAASGWEVDQYVGERAAAPFAILDTVVVGAEYLTAEGLTSLGSLDLHWSSDNVAAYDDGNPNPTTGEIGSSFFGFNPLLGIDGIYLLGEENGDTEEYDRHVILHEFGHYLERNGGRSDSIGGPHSRGDRLDPRVAFSEGWATALAALALGDPVYRDTGGLRQAGSFSFNIEGPSAARGDNPAPGWYSEESIWELFYDLVDANVDEDGRDLLNYPISEIWSVMVGRVVTTPALVTVFPFLHAFADAHPADRSLLEDLLAVQFISALDSDYAAGETNDAGSVDVLPLYTELTVNGDPVTVCSTDEFTSPRTGAENKLGSRQFIRFTPASGTVRIRVAASLIPEGEYSDPDWRLYRFDQLVGVSIESPNAACENYAASNWTPGNCVEPNPGSVAEPAVVVGAEHILEVYEWTHIIDDDDHPPIGRTCFNVTVTQ